MLAIKNKVYFITSLFFLLCCCFQIFSKLDYVVTSHLVAEITLFVVFLKYRKNRDSTVFLFWVSFILATVVVFFYKDCTYGPITTILKLFGYFMLLFYVYPKQKKIKNVGLDFVVYSIVFFINIYVVYEIIEMIMPYLNAAYMKVLFFIYGIALILLYIFAFRYRLLKHTTSKYFLLLSIFLLLAEVVGVGAHFLDYTFLYYFEYFFYLFGLCFAVRAFMENSSETNLELIKT